MHYRARSRAAPGPRRSRLPRARSCCPRAARRTRNRPQPTPPRPPLRRCRSPRVASSRSACLSCSTPSGRPKARARWRSAPASPASSSSRLYNEGANVTAGQTLFQIERAPFEIAVAQARAALAQERGEAGGSAARGGAPAAARRDTRDQPREYDQARVRGEDVQRGDRSGAKAKLAEAQLNLSYTQREGADLGHQRARAALGGQPRHGAAPIC